MKKNTTLTKSLAVFLALLLGASQAVFAQSGGGDAKAFKQEELDQLLAPIALYPDSLLAQILMASTYPLEVVQAGKWAKANQALEGDALSAALEKEDWDPSVKSLVNFPQVLDMMNDKLDWTQKLGDAFLAQQKGVMDTVQKLREKAEAEGNLKSSEQQKVVVEKETQTIIIEPADPQVVYVPTYNPTVVYGAWWYPSYPPYYYYPPGYAAGAALFSFGVGVAVGAAWGYAWGGCNWRGGNVDINVNRNTNINNNIDRSKYQNKVTSGQGGRGEWKHDPEHRKGVSYRDQGTAQKFDRGASRDAQSREAFRGRAEAGRQDIARGDAGQFRDRAGSGDRSSQDRPNAGSMDRAGSGNRGSQDRPNAGSMDRAGSGNQGSQDRPNAGSMDRAGSQPRKDSGGIDRAGSTQRTDKSAFGSYDRGSQTRDSSNRGHQSMSSSRAGRGGGSGASRGGSGGGMSRGGGGGGRGGGGRGR